VCGGGGPDSIYGGRGDDSLEGSGGPDMLRGGRGDDTILGGESHDEIFGDRGDDVINGGAGADILTGGKGRDVFDYDSIEDAAAHGHGDDHQEPDDGGHDSSGGQGHDTGDDATHDDHGGSGEDDHGSNRPREIITDFRPGVDIIDLVDIEGVLAYAEGPTANAVWAEQAGEYTILKIDTDGLVSGENPEEAAIWLEDVAACELSAGDFLF
jgi:Ca2+-binding RTX toxin-like protein